MNIKLLITDLDDTLISDYTPVSKNVIETIEKVKQKGIKAAIATGRMHSSAFPYAKDLDIVEPIISYNGALIKHVDSDEIILHKPVNYDDAIEVLNFAKETNIFVQYYSTREYYVGRHCEASELYCSKTGRKAVAVDNELIKTLDFEPTKLLMITKNQQEGKKIYMKAKEIFGGRLYITQSSDTYVEFNNPEASKGSACRELAKYYGYDIKDIMAIGNGGNDVDMIKVAGFGIAVGNAVQEAKEAADYICPPQSEDGAITAIEQFLLNR